MYFIYDELFYLKCIWRRFEEIDNNFYVVPIGDKNQEYMTRIYDKNLWQFEIWLNGTCSFSFWF